MELTHRDKSIIKSVIEGFTYHQKYRLYAELAKDLKEDDEFKETLESATKKVNAVLRSKSSRNKK